MDEQVKTETEEHIEIEMQITDETKQAFGLCKASDVDEEERTVVAVISTDSIDRDGEVLNPKGMNADNFRKNPVVLWSHENWTPPIGKALWLKRKGNQIIAKVKFAATERAEEVWQLFKGGFLNAFSVGFKPKEGRRPTPDDIKASPALADARFIFTKWELLEFSPVAIPANPDALAQAIKSKSVNVSDELIKAMDIELTEEIPFEEIKIPVSEIAPKKAMKVEICDVKPIIDVAVIG